MKKKKDPYVDPLTLMQQHNRKYRGKYAHTPENHPLRSYSQPSGTYLSEEDRPTTYAVYCTLCEVVHPNQSLEEREMIWKSMDKGGPCLVKQKNLKITKEEGEGLYGNV